MNSRTDYCNTVLAGAPRTVTEKLQRVLNAAARVVTGTQKFDRGLCQMLHEELHWLDVPDRVIFKLAVTVHRCLNGRAPPYLSDYCVPVADADTRRHLRSTNRQLLAVPRYRLNTYGVGLFRLPAPQSGTLSRISSGTRPSVRTVSDGCLKRTCSLDTSAFSALEVLTITALYKFTYLLTYLLTDGSLISSVNNDAMMLSFINQTDCNLYTRFVFIVCLFAVAAY